MAQSYQEVSKVIIKNLAGLARLGVSNIKRINLKEFQGEYQEYFFYRKNLHPEKYERLHFDENGSEPYSEDLGEIVMDFVLAGFLNYDKDIKTRKSLKYFNSEQ